MGHTPSLAGPFLRTRLKTLLRVFPLIMCHTLNAEHYFCQALFSTSTIFLTFDISSVLALIYQYFSVALPADTSGSGSG